MLLTVTMFSMNKHISKHLLGKAEKGEYVHEESGDEVWIVTTNFRKRVNIYNPINGMKQSNT